MSKKYLPLFVLLLVALMGYAKEGWTAEPSPRVDPALCQALTKYVPDADVAYQPGVDVDGNAVAPADLPGSSQMQMPSKLEIPLTLNLARHLHLPSNVQGQGQNGHGQGGQGAEAWLGVITVEGDQVSFNGQPLTDTQQENLAVLCLNQK